MKNWKMPMAWNEPGGGKDPWSNPRGGGGGKPPNIDDVLKRMRGKFGGGNGGSPGGAKGILAILVIVFVAWMISGIHIVDEGQRGVVLTFGKYTKTAEPGPHWFWPQPITRVLTVNVDEYRDRELSMSVLTADENIVEVRLASQFNVKDSYAFLFEVRDPDGTLRDVMQSAIREVIGSSRMDYVLTGGRVEIVAAVRERMQDLLDGYNTGLQVQSVNLQDVQPPEPVQPAFEDAIRAREDEQRFINEALAYANQIVPRARGEAAQILEQASGYRSRVINAAMGEASRFNQLLQSYRLAPEITRERIFVDTVGDIYARGNKIMSDPKSSNILYLPMEGRDASGSFDFDAGLRSPINVPSLSPNVTGQQQNFRDTSSRPTDSLRTRGNE